MVRLVKLKFRTGKKEAFILTFKAHEMIMKEVEGCNHIELWQDHHNADTMMTYSIWDSERHLNNYRRSETFHHVWSIVKPFFAEPAQVTNLGKVIT